MKPAPHIATLLLLALLSGCASQPTTPDWIAGDSARHPAAQYLTGRGQAATQDEAKDRARADIAKVFQVAVVASSEDVQRARTDATGGQSFEEQATRRVSTRSEQILSGIEIAELWQDPGSGAHHALAILPRLQTANSLRQQIAELDAATASHIERSRSEQDLLLKIAAAHHAVLAQQERETLQKNLQVVDATGQGVAPRWSSARLRTDLVGLLQRVSIAPRVAPDAPSGFAAMVAGALAQAGFRLDEQPRFVLQAGLKLTDLGLQDGWHWMRGNLEIALIETAGNRVRGTRIWTIKGNAQNKADAMRRTLNQADSLLQQELGKTIIEMAIAK